MVFVRSTRTVTYGWAPQQTPRDKLQYRKPTKSLIRAKTFEFLQKQAQPRITRTAPKQEPLSLSLDDICHLAERERLCYSARNRREAMEEAQNTTHKFDEVLSSRPHTSASRYIHEVRREDLMTPKSLRSEPVPSRVNSRLGPSEFDDDDDSVYPMNYLASLPVGREICEIIGPQVCSQCRQDQTKRSGMAKCNQCFPSMGVSHENMTTAAVLRKYLPDLSEYDIQNKIARGEIAKPKILRKRLNTKCNNDTKTDIVKTEKDSENSNVVKTTPRTQSMFFVNIRDLNSKIISGQLHRMAGFSEKVQQEVLRRQEQKRKLNALTKKRDTEGETEKKERKARFNPDILLSLSMQTNEPSFFAGRKQEYELPERLPDPIRFVDVKGPKADDANKDFQLYGLEEEPEDEEVADYMS